MLVTTYADKELALRVGTLQDVETTIWDWRTSPPSGAALRTIVLISEFSPNPPAAELLSALQHLRVVQLPSAGYDDWQQVLKPGTLLCNGRSVHGQSTAEAALTGVLALLREIPRAVQQQAQRQWSPISTQVLGGRRVVVLGAGDIGTRIARLFRGFECEVTVVGRSQRPGVHGSSELQNLVVQADILVLAVPLDDSTRGACGAGLLAALPVGAIVANVSRGPVVDTAALTAEVSIGRLRAYLDVTDPEPLPVDHPLWELPGAILTPHTGGGDESWRERYAELARDQICRFRDGKPLRNVVSSEPAPKRTNTRIDPFSKGPL